LIRETPPEKAAFRHRFWTTFSTYFPFTLFITRVAKRQFGERHHRRDERTTAANRDATISGNTPRGGLATLLLCSFSISLCTTSHVGMVTMLVRWLFQKKREIGVGRFHKKFVLFSIKKGVGERIGSALSSHRGLNFWFGGEGKKVEFYRAFAWLPTHKVLANLDLVKGNDAQSGGLGFLPLLSLLSTLPLSAHSDGWSWKAFTVCCPCMGLVVSYGWTKIDCRKEDFLEYFPSYVTGACVTCVMSSLGLPFFRFMV
jgi:hypothetical protein